MGAIHERLQGIQDALALEQSTKLEHERKKNEIRLDPDLLYQAQLSQYENYRRLESFGIFKMIEDATEGLEISKDAPLHRSDGRLGQRQLEKLFPTQSDAKKWLDEARSNKNKFNSMLGGLHWSFSIPEPYVKDDLTFDTSISIILRREARPSGGRLVLGHDNEKERVTLKYDGTALQIEGSEIVFNDTIPDNESMRQEVLENAFVEAFYSTKKIDNHPLPRPSWDQLIGSEAS